MPAEKSSKANRRLVTGIIVFCAACLLTFSALWVTAPPSPPAPPEPSKYGWTKFGCVCAKSYEYLGSVLEAYRSEDASALEGLIVRGQALNLADGVKVYRLAKDGIEWGAQ